MSLNINLENSIIKLLPTVNNFISKTLIPINAQLKHVTNFQTEQ